MSHSSGGGSSAGGAVSRLVIPFPLFLLEMIEDLDSGCMSL